MLPRDLGRPLEGRGVGELDVQDQIPLVFVGNEARGELTSKGGGQEREAPEDHEADDGLADQPPREVHVAAGGPREPPVEDAEEAAQRPCRLVARPQEQRREGRRQRQGVERGDHHRDRDGHGELLVEASLDAAHEADRDEHGGQDEGDAHHRRRDLRHGLQRGFPGREPFLDVVLDRLHHDDGVVHHEADGEDEAEEGQRVDGEAQEGEEGEGPDEGHRNGDQGDEGRAPVLEEQEDDQDDENHRLPEGARDLLHPLGDRQRGVEAHLVVEVAREALLELGHHVLDALRDREGVGSRRLEGGDEGRGPSVEAPRLVVREGPQLDARDVLESHDRPLGGDADHDGSELFGGDETPLGAHAVGELLARRRRLRAHASGGVDGVLLLQRAQEVGDRQAQLGQLVGLDPDPHRVLRQAEVHDLPDTRDAVQGVVDVDEGVVSEEEGVVGAVGRIDGHDHEGQAHGAAVREPELVHVGRKVGRGLGHAVLGVDLIDVDVALHVEGHRQRHRPVVGVRGLQVEGLVHAVHLLLEGRRHRLLDGDGVGAGVGRLDLDRRRDDGGELGDGKARHRHEAENDRDDGDHDGDDGPIDEESGH